MNLFIKILLFVFVALVANVNIASETITFSNIQESMVYSSFNTDITKSVFKYVEKGVVNCCENE